MGTRDRRPILVVIGVLLLLVGLGAAFLGPVEMYCFYLFSEGGRFHYDGFGFGSFMFGNIAWQIVGYYLIALVAIPLGYGHLKVRRWARTLSLTLLWFWRIVGLPLTVTFLFIALASKDIPLAGVIMMVIALALSYLVLPGLLIRFYRSRDVRLTFQNRDPKSCWTESVPIPVLVLCALYVFTAILLHVPIFFNGLFPLFGTFLSGLDGIVALDVAILVLLCLAWGTFKLRAWAWWGSLAYFVGLTTSALFTLGRSSYADILSVLDFPPREMEFLQGLPLHGVHFAVFIGIPLLATLGAIVRSKRHFTARGRVFRR